MNVFVFLAHFFSRISKNLMTVDALLWRTFSPENNQFLRKWLQFLWIKKNKTKKPLRLRMLPVLLLLHPQPRSYGLLGPSELTSFAAAPS